VAALFAAVLGVMGSGLLLAPPVAAAVTPPGQGVTVSQAPLPNDAGSNPKFYSASATCPATGQCVMAGTYYDGANHPWGLIETQSGTSWTPTEAPEPSNAGSGANQNALLGSTECGFSADSCTAVACPTTTWCVAVGQYKDSAGHINALIDTLAGGTWTALEGPVPGNAGTGANQAASLISVACTSTTSCVAVGEYENSAGRDEGLIEVLSGTTWTATEAPVPGDAGTGSDQFSIVTELACPSSTSCVAVGQYENAAAAQSGVIETWNGTTWSAATTPVPNNSGTGTSYFVRPFAVACTAATACQVVGVYEESAGHVVALVDSLVGTQWTAIAGPEPSDAGTGTNLSAQLLEVSCPTATYCVATGSYLNGAARTTGLIETLSGTTWAASAAPEPADAATGSNLFGVLFDVTCPTTSSCLASGSYEATGSVQTVLVDTLSAGRWTAGRGPLPTNALSPSPVALGKSVACASPVACIVSGAYEDASSNVLGFLDTFTGLQGYWLGASDGGIFSFGNAPFYGSTGSIVLNKSIVGMAATPDNQGYWLVASDGGVFSFGDAKFFGSTGALQLNKPIVGMAPTPDGLGYWLVASDGGIFSFGDAKFFGSTGAIVLNKPIVGMAAAPDGNGYWLVATDGGIFTFGSATFMGSTGSIKLNKPIVGMGASPNGDGYWLVASDGGIFTFGNVLFYGSTGAIALNKPIVGMAVSPSGHGYWLVASDGGIFTFGDPLFYGSTGAIVLNKPIVGMAI
jgi:hypothetical protein